MLRKYLLLPLFAAAPLALAACESATGPGAGEGRVAVRFGTSRPAGSAQAQGSESLTITGTNGTLVLTDVRLVVAEFELDGDDNINQCQNNGGADDCEDFNAGPTFVDLPLGAGQTTVASGDIPNGTYDELEFEVEDLDDDEEDPAERARIEALRQQIVAQFPEWPRDASMLVVGTFQPTGGAAVPFRVFIDAEIEIELGLNPPLVVTDASTSRSVDVTLDLAAVFKNGSNVINLSQSTGRLLELEFELERGFRGGSGSSGSGGNSGPGGGS